MTEADLTKLVKRVIQEQAQIRSVTDTMSKPAPKQSVGKLTATVSKPAPKQSDGKLISTVSKTDSESWFSNFPCLNEVPQSKRPMVNGNIILKTYTTPFTLLPESGKGDSQYSFAINQGVVNRYVGQIKGGGVYYCSSAPSAKGFGPQIAKLN